MEEVDEERVGKFFYFIFQRTNKTLNRQEDKTHEAAMQIRWHVIIIL